MKGRLSRGSRRAPHMLVILRPLKRPTHGDVEAWQEATGMAGSHRHGFLEEAFQS